MKRVEPRYDMLPHGVHIVTAAHDGKQAGLALAYATQLSNDRLLLAIGNQSYTQELLLASGSFGLTSLAADQQDIAAQFGFSSSRDHDKFAGVGWHAAETGSPLLDDGLVALDCRVETVHDEPATHAKLVIGRVVVCELLRAEGGESLLFYQDDYA